MGNPATRNFISVLSKATIPPGAMLEKKPAGEFQVRNRLVHLVLHRGRALKPHRGQAVLKEGTYPTPKGLIRVRHEKQADGSVKSTVELPEGVVQE